MTNVDAAELAMMRKMLHALRQAQHDARAQQRAQVVTVIVDGDTVRIFGGVPRGFAAIDNAPP